MPQLVWQKAEARQDVRYDVLQILVWYLLQQASNPLQHHAVYPFYEAVGPAGVAEVSGHDELLTCEGIYEKHRGTRIRDRFSPPPVCQIGT